MSADVAVTPRPMTAALSSQSPGSSPNQVCITSVMSAPAAIPKMSRIVLAPPTSPSAGTSATHTRVWQRSVNTFDYVVQAVPMTTLTLGAVEEIGASKKDGQRAKNMFALGLLSWMYHRPTEGTERFLREKFAKKPDIADKIDKIDGTIGITGAIISLTEIDTYSPGSICG